jgi:hypothetical protein
MDQDSDLPLPLGKGELEGVLTINQSVTEDFNAPQDGLESFGIRLLSVTNSDCDENRGGLLEVVTAPIEDTPLNPPFARGEGRDGRGALRHHVTRGPRTLVVQDFPVPKSRPEDRPSPVYGSDLNLSWILVRHNHHNQHVPRALGAADAPAEAP